MDLAMKKYKAWVTRVVEETTMIEFEAPYEDDLLRYAEDKLEELDDDVEWERTYIRDVFIDEIEDLEEI